jgi:hypothetical protein
MRATSIILSVLILSFAACSSSSQQPTDARVERRLHDGPALVPDLPVLPTDWKFTPEDAGQSPAVALKLEQLDGDKATLLVIGRGLTPLQGVAFRLTFPPAQATVSSSEAGAAWSGALSRFATRAEGELWAGIGQKGAHGISTTGDLELARVVLQLSGTTAIKVGFRANRNVVLDPKPQRVTATWLGGTFERK